METSEERLILMARKRGQLPLPAVRRLIREAVGISQDELGRALGVSGACVSRWESGERTPRGKHLDGYVDLLQRLASGVIS